ncbi:hypothetical protein SC206_21305 [Rouxiella sp. T17]|uniref:hypothetical protein n=1 Tax=Rouxiella sp. T17 TaxID=3085684 RepID=UPI002FCAB3CC
MRSHQLSRCARPPARRKPDGTMEAFPGNHWNEWQPGKEASEAFVYLNSVHIFDDV